MSKNYWDAKQAVLEFLDREAPMKDVLANYLHPQDAPAFNAATTMQALGLGGSGLTQRRRKLNDFMRGHFGAPWKSIGVISIKAVATIGDLIKLAAVQLDLGMPDGEPT